MSFFYLIFILLTAYFSFRYDRVEEYDSHKQHRLWLMCGYLICLTGFSYGLGADKFAYMADFEACPDNFSEAGEYVWRQMMFRGLMPLWTILNLSCKVFFNSFYVVQFIESIVINIAVCYVIRKYTQRYFLFLLIYFFSLQYFIFNTEIMREGFALAIVLIGMNAYLDGKKWVFYSILPIAFLFHVSAFIALLFPFTKYKLSWKTLLYAFCLSFSLWLFSDLILGKIILMAFGGQGAFAEKVLFYSMQATTIFGFTRSVITHLVFPYIIMYYSVISEPSEELKEKKMRIVAYMVPLAIIASSFAGPGFVRLYNYIQIFYLTMLTDFTYNLLRSQKHLIIRGGALVGTIFLLMLSYLAHYESTNTYFYEFFYPYTCILDENDGVYFRQIAHQEATTFEVADNNVRDIE